MVKKNCDDDETETTLFLLGSASLCQYITCGRNREKEKLNLKYQPKYFE